MANMKQKKATLTEKDIDEIVIKEADMDSRWGRPIRVKPRIAAALLLSAKTVARAKSIARRWKSAGYQEWLLKVIEERIASEESNRRLTQRRTRVGTAR
jgi:hypothetical protein